MADKKNDKYLSLHPEDFVGTVWDDICDSLGISNSVLEVRIYYTQEDLVEIEQETSDDSTTKDSI